MVERIKPHGGIVIEGGQVAPLIEVPPMPKGPFCLVITGNKGDGSDYCPDCATVIDNLQTLALPFREVYVPVGRADKGDKTAANFGGRRGVLMTAREQLPLGLLDTIKGDPPGNFTVPYLVAVRSDGHLHDLNYNPQHSEELITLVGQSPIAGVIGQTQKATTRATKEL